MRLVREILIYYECLRNVLRSINLFYEWYKCLGMLVNAIANLTNLLQMKQDHKTWLTNLHNTHCRFLFVLYLPGPVQLAYFPSNLYSFSTFILHSTEMSIRMQMNLYEGLKITTNALPSIRMACDCFRICC